MRSGVSKSLVIRIRKQAIFTEANVVPSTCSSIPSIPLLDPRFLATPAQLACVSNAFASLVTVMNE
jgi:hypothetical protein